MKKDSALQPQTHRHLEAHHRDFEEFAQRMVESHAGRFDPVFWGFLESHLPRSGTIRRIVDLGTGPGLLPLDLARRFTEAQVIGVDAQPRMLERARKNVEAFPDRVRIVARDLAAPPIAEIEEGSVDLLIASMVIHEMEVPVLALDECARMLRPGGTLLIYDWVRQPLESYFEGKRPESIDDFTHFSEHCRYTPEDLAWLGGKSGFSLLEWMARHDGRHVLMAFCRGAAQ